MRRLVWSLTQAGRQASSLLDLQGKFVSQLPEH